MPPLRERPDDVLLLARHFLEAFALQYSKGVRGFDAAAEELLEAYVWPGNVRELQNTILQAVVLAEGDVVSADDLQISEGSSTSTGNASQDARERRAGHNRPALSRGSRGRRTGNSCPTGREARRLERPCRSTPPGRHIADRLAAEVAAAVSAATKHGPPLAKWLARDLVIAAFEEASGVATKAAALLGLPETTFSRRLRQAEAEAATYAHHRLLGIRARGALRSASRLRSTCRQPPERTGRRAVSASHGASARQRRPRRRPDGRLGPHHETATLVGYNRIRRERKVRLVPAPGRCADRTIIVLYRVPTVPAVPSRYPCFAPGSGPVRRRARPAQPTCPPSQCTVYFVRSLCNHPFRVMTHSA